jgi:two-component system, response regulator
MAGMDILLIEDNRHDAEMIKEAICEQGGSGTLRVFADGTEALDCFFGPRGLLDEAPVHLPRLVLLDLKLPKIGGVDILKRLKSDERTRMIPVVIFTSSNEPQDRRECYRHGANSYIVKPMDADRFSRFVAAIRSYWVVTNRTAYADHGRLQRIS